MHAAATDDARFGSSPRHIIDGRREERRRETGGVINVPGRILATLQRKFWDSNKVCFEPTMYSSSRGFVYSL